MHRPGRRQVLERGGDFLDQQVDRQAPILSGRAEVGGACAADAGLQPLEVLLRIPEAVRMIDAQSVDLARTDELEQKPLRILEYRQVFDAQPGEVVHVEKPPIVDLIGRNTPRRESIRLRLQQLVQVVERFVIAGSSRKAAYHRLDGLAEPRIAVAYG